MSTVAIGNPENPRKVRKFDACQENVGKVSGKIMLGKTVY